jgi:hypothetical protein
MEQFIKGINMLKEFYGRHKTIIDILAQNDEMFRAVKEISENEMNFQP